MITYKFLFSGHPITGVINMDIRQAIYAKLHNVSADELKVIIDDGIASKEETILPGLGVLFESYYNSLSSKDELLQKLSQLLK